MFDICIFVSQTFTQCRAKNKKVDEILHKRCGYPNIHVIDYYHWHTMLCNCL